LNPQSIAIGLVAGVAAAVIGGSWQVATRHATTTTIGPTDLAILRYVIPALILLPVTARIGVWPARIPRRLLLAMLVGAGLPFGLVAMAGSRFAPAAHMGVLMAGASPLFATALAWWWWRDRPEGGRAAGLVLMALGVAVLGARAFSGGLPGAWRGDLLFLLAALLWALFTLSFRRSGLTPWQGAALVNTWAALALVPWLLWRGSIPLLGVPLRDVVLQAALQGLVAGLLGLWTYSVAITELGPARAASFGALAPVVSALGGYAWLGDALTLLDGVAVACAVLGVGMVSGGWRRQPAADVVPVRPPRLRPAPPAD